MPTLTTFYHGLAPSLLDPMSRSRRGGGKRIAFFSRKKNERRLLPNLCCLGEKSWQLLRLSVVPFYWVPSDLDLVSEGWGNFLPEPPAAPSLEPSNHDRCSPALQYPEPAVTVMFYFPPQALANLERIAVVWSVGDACQRQCPTSCNQWYVVQPSVLLTGGELRQAKRQEHCSCLGEGSQ